MADAVDPFAVTAREHERSVHAYREARAGRLTADKGWLSLIAKVWLSNGVYRIGSRPGSDIELPAGRAPDHLATLTMKDGRAELVAAPAAQLRARGAPIESLVLRSDAEQAPDEVTSGPFSLDLIRRGDDFALRVRDAESPRRRGFKDIPAFPIEPAWRIVARFEPYAEPREVILADNDGRPQTHSAPGLAVLEKDGAVHRLEPLLEGAKRLFILFGDATNRDATYGGGRFLYAPLAQDGRVLLDFNLAFNPPCAFTPYASCPLPSGQNRLPMRVEAGEKRPATP